MAHLVNTAQSPRILYQPGFRTVSNIGLGDDKPVDMSILNPLAGVYNAGKISGPAIYGRLTQAEKSWITGAPFYSPWNQYEDPNTGMMNGHSLVKQFDDLPASIKKRLNKMAESPIFKDKKIATRFTIPMGIKATQLKNKPVVKLVWNKQTGYLEPARNPNGKYIIDELGKKYLGVASNPKTYQMDTMGKVIVGAAALAITASAAIGTGLIASGAAPAASTVPATAPVTTTTAITAGTTIPVTTGAALTSGTTTTVAGGAATGAGLLGTLKTAGAVIPTAIGLAKTTGIIKSSTQSQTSPNQTDSPYRSAGSFLSIQGISPTILYIGGGLILLTILTSILRR